jgi:hypothetical protein
MGSQQWLTTINLIHPQALDMENLAAEITSKLAK